MEYIDYINFLLKYIFIHLITYFFSTKITNFKSFTFKNNLTVILSCIILSALLTVCGTFIKSSYLLLASCFALGILYTYITKYKFDDSIFVTFIALTITVILYEISIFISLLICIPILHLNERNPIILLFAIIIESLFVHLIFKIKRLKNGFSFLNNKERPYGLVILPSIIVVLIITNLSPYISDSINELSLLCLSLILLSMFLWIKEKITLHYKSLLTKDTIENLQN